MMKCEVIRDLLPTYADGLASEETAALIEEHLAECGECRELLRAMKEDTGVSPEEAAKDAKEIDFLKKSRSKGRRAVLAGILLTLALVLGVAGARLYLVGSEYRGDLACQVKVDGSTMEIGATSSDSAKIISGMEVSMEEGVVQCTPKAVLPGLKHSSGTFPEGEQVTCDWSGTFSFDEEIREVRVGDRICWANGKEISPKASAVYSAGHEYIGDASANSASLEALGVTEDLGSLYSELQTEKEPYGWTVVLDEDQAKYDPAYLEKRLKGYAYALLGTVGNLDQVAFRYTADGKTRTVEVTKEEATAFLGKDIKTCRSDAAAVSELMEKAGIE